MGGRRRGGPRGARGLPGDFLPDCDGPWLHEQRGALASLRVRALEGLAEASLRSGELGEALAAARAAVVAAPFRESAHRLLMEAHDAAGNPAEALRAFEDLRRLLREELGTAPGAAALAVHERLLHGGAPAPAPPSRVPEARRWPAPLDAARGRHAFVGRAAEASDLHRAWHAVAAGGRGLVVLAGEAGIGKTRLAAELGGHAHADDAVVLYGRFDDEAPAPYQPFVQMLRGWAGGASLAPLARAPRRRARRSWACCCRSSATRRRARTGRCAARRSTRSGCACSTRWRRCSWRSRATRRCSSCSTTCTGRTGRRSSSSATSCAPRRPSARCSSRRRARRRGARRSARCSGASSARACCERVDLGGPRRAETGALVVALGGRAATPAFVDELHGETDGNPFFIEEVVHHLADADGNLGGALALHEAGVPEGVREVTGRRLARLGEPARQMLATARRDRARVRVRRARGGRPARAATSWSPRSRRRSRRGVLREDAERVGRYAFGHALMRATLYDGLSALRRARLHGRVGEALIARRGARPRPAPRPARAPLRAGRAGRAARARRRLRAGRRPAGGPPARVGGGGRPLPRRRCARASWPAPRTTGCAASCCSRSAPRRSAPATPRRGRRSPPPPTTARALGDPVLLGRAALGYAGRWSQLGRVEEDVAALLQEALDALGDEDSPLRARLLARLALELYYAGDPERRLALSEEAVALARRLGDPPRSAMCLDARHYALWRPETVQERLEVASELRRIAEAGRRPRARARGRRLDRRRPAGAGRRRGRRRPDRGRLAPGRGASPAALRVVDDAVALRARQLDGRFEEAERLAHETLAIGRRGQEENAMHVFAQAMFNIRREQGRLAEVEDAVRGFIAMYPAVPAWRCTLALLHVELGREAAARAEFEALAEAGFDTLPRDANG